MPISTDHCLHCLAQGDESKPINKLGLCPTCARKKRIRILYKTRWDRPSGWEEHLERLAERARQGLPLFDEQDTQDRRNLE
jgi:hypothetical protein